MRVLVGTRKGLMILEGAEGQWSWRPHHFTGVKCSLAVYDPVNRCIWAALKHGHWGPKLHRSKDGGASFEEVATPTFPEGSSHSLKDTWAISVDPGGRVYLGTEPAAVFHSDDLGASWQVNEAMLAMPSRGEWMAAASEETCLHSLIVDPRNPDQLLAGISVAGILRSEDRGLSWQWSSKGCKAYYMPDPDTEIGQDPHALAAHPTKPDVIWQQNHCGLFASSDGGRLWHEYSKAKGVVSAFGWAIVVADDAHGSIYTVPAHSDECRVTVEGTVFVQVSRDGGLTWRALREGLPQRDAWDICYRHGLDARGQVVAFGSTTGNLYLSEDAGEHWRQVAAHLPPIYSVRIAP